MSVHSRLRTLAIALFLTILAITASAQAGKSHHAKKNSVVSSSIKNGQVKHKDLAKEAVSAKNLQPDTLTGKEIREAKLDFSVLQQRIGGVCGAGTAVSAVHSDGTVECANDSTGADWSLKGNKATTPGTNFIGTTDDQALLFKVNSRRALRIEPGSTSPNLIGGFPANSVTSGVNGATIAGGGQLNKINQVTGSYGAVGGGYLNTAGVTAVVAGGLGNTATNSSVIGGGQFNTASGNSSTVAGGAFNTVSGFDSFAAGQNATDQTHGGVFVFSDSSLAMPFKAIANNEFAVRSTGGARFVTATDGSGNPTAGVQLASGGGSWSSLSDRNAKNHVHAVSSRAVLRKVRSLPVHSWSYKTQDPSIRHLGPMAQAFAKRFGLGEDHRHIDDVDAQGVALAAVQGAAKRIRAQQREIESLKRAVRRLEHR